MSIIASVATAVLIIGKVVPFVEEVTNAVAVGAVVFVGTNGALILSRVYRETKWRTDRARTGESHASRLPDEESDIDG